MEGIRKSTKSEFGKDSFLFYIDYFDKNGRILLALNGRIQYDK